MSRVETIGDAILYLSDCRDILPTLSKVDAIVTDPPYGMGAYKNDNAAGVVSNLNDWTHKAVFAYPEILCEWCAAWGKPDEWVTWWPTNKFGHSSKTLPRNSEAIAIFGHLYEMPIRKREADKATIKIARAQGNIVSDDNAMARDGDVWRDPAPGIGFNSHQRQHPNEKPISLMNKLLRLCTCATETVIDPYMGSGTTGVAAINLSRKFIGIEIDPTHFDVACLRIEQACSQMSLAI